MIAFGTLQMFLLAAVMFAGAGALMVSALVHPLLSASERWAPERRHRALVLIALLPPVLGVTGIVSVTLPSLLGLVWPALDHCLIHGGHSHLCFVHGSLHAGHSLGWSALAIFVVWQLVWLARGGVELLKAASAVRALMRSARHDAERGYWVVSSSSPLCVSVGLFRPRLLLSDGLLEQLSQTNLQVIVAHERAHERRKDSLVRLVVRVATAFVVPRTRRTLLAALEASAERACDERAAAAIGDRLAVAEALLAVERKFAPGAATPGNAMIMGFGGSSVVARVDAMLAPACGAGSSKLLAAAVVAAVGVLLGGFQQVHHVTESLLGHLGH